jgi:N-ethylmaleimide reductase
MKILFSKTILGSLTLQNHLVMAPMTRSRATDNIPNALMMEYYSQRATAGLIITEGTSPSPNGLGYPRIPGIFSPGVTTRSVPKATWPRANAISSPWGDLSLLIPTC